MRFQVIMVDDLRLFESNLISMIFKRSSVAMC